MRNLFLGILVIVFILAWFLSSVDIKVGDGEHVAQKEDVENSNFYDEYFTKKDTIVLNVWATWCKPCISEIPKLNKLANHPGTNTNFLSISIDKDSSALAKFIEKKEFDFKDITFSNQEYVFSILNLLENKRSGKDFNGMIPRTYVIHNQQVINHVLGKMDEGWTY